MRIPKITPLSFKSVAFTLLIITFAFAIRLWPLGSLGNNLAWLTFYPAVMIIAIYGGFYSGLIGTFFSCIFIDLFYFLVTANPFINKSADYLGMIFFAVTGIMISIVAEAMKEANRKAKTEQEKAQAANQAKSVFLANMSHELRTPLNAVLGYAQIIKNDDEISDKNREFLNIISRSGEHLLSLINDVLEIAKIESKNLKNERNNFNFRGLIKDLEYMFTLQANSKNIILSIKGIENTPEYIIADEKKIKVVLINLIGNAIKFTEKGAINISFVHMYAQNEFNKLNITIEDTGYGISEEEQTGLFAYFYQTESGRLNKSGTGLGLSISQDYVKLMGGQIVVESIRGTGSTFSFTIDIEQGKEEIPDKNPLKTVIAFKKLQTNPKILIAEDNDDNRYLLKYQLNNVGFLVNEANNGKEAVDVFNNWQPDLIFMDIRMPVMNGLEASKIIKAKSNNKKVIIVALSAHIFKNELDEIFDAGCDDFLGKPYQENEIFQMLAKHLKIEFIYKAIEKKTYSKGKILEIDRETLSVISKSLITELNQAVLELNQNEIIKTISKVSEENETIGKALLFIAKEMDYTKLLYLTE